MPTTMSLAELLREQRSRRGRSLREAANEMGIAPSQLSRMENGKRGMNATLGQVISSYYDIPPDILAIAEGRLPPDIAAILLRHPEELSSLRLKYKEDRDGIRSLDD